ncbi:MAG: ABC transporter permease subunit [Proteobacteria bacterium]|nr:ABC transporter permease subunit [Pseudomonadota bacterium]
MSAASTTTQAVGRSLWADARVRLLRNRAAMASLIFLGLMTIACLIGPYVTGHAFDRVYSDYVKVEASLAAHPAPEAIGPALDRVAARLRAKVDDFKVANDVATVTLIGIRPIDERSLALFERSDLFHAAKIVEKLDEGKKLVVSVPVERNYFFFGTDGNGRDLLTRTLIAGRVSLAIGLLATFVAITIGVTYGAVSGFFGGRVDVLMMRAVDVLYSLPFIFFVIMLVVFFGRNFVLMFLAVGAVEWLDMARIVRGQTLSLKRREFVQAAEVLGVPTSGILKRHIVPNTLGPVIVYTTLLVPRVILLESFLSFLGLGVQEPMTSWGVLISDGARNIQGATYMLVFPALFLTTTLFSLNFIGDGLRDALDPRDR